MCPISYFKTSSTIDFKLVEPNVFNSISATLHLVTHPFLLHYGDVILFRLYATTYVITTQHSCALALMPITHLMSHPIPTPIWMILTITIFIAVLIICVHRLDLIQYLPSHHYRPITNVSVRRLSCLHYLHPRLQYRASLRLFFWSPRFYRRSSMRKRWRP